MHVEDVGILEPETNLVGVFTDATRTTAMTSAATLDSVIWGARRRSLAISERKILLFLMDITLLLFVGYGLSWDHKGPGNFPGLALLFMIPWLVFGNIGGLYDLSTAAREKACLKALAITAACFDLTLLLAFLVRPYFASRPKLILLALVAPAAIALWRLAYIKLFGAAHFERRVMIVGGGTAGLMLLRAIRRYDGHGVKVVGILDDDARKVGTEMEGVPVLGSSQVLWPSVSDLNIEEVVLAVNEPTNPSLYQGLAACYEHGLAVSVMPKVYEEVTGQVPVELMAPHWFGSVQLGRTGGSMTFAVKRTIDLVLSTVGVVVSFPLIVALALLVRMTSRGPVFHTQRRVGLHGKTFRIIKFRTMREDAEMGSPVWASVHDPRATKVGRWLRRTHLDELPQLFLVLKGDMSLVGPRPERPEFVRELEGEIPLYRARYSMRPGIAGWAQLNYPYGASRDDALAKLRYDLYYVKNWSLFLDTGILMRTLTRVLGLRGR